MIKTIKVQNALISYHKYLDWFSKLFINWFHEGKTIPKDRPIYFMHGVIRMVRLGISSHDPPKPEGSTKG